MCVALVFLLTPEALGKLTNLENLCVCVRACVVVVVVVVVGYG